MSDEPDRKKPDDEDAWIDKVVNVLGHLGFNKMRLRWKLIRWQDNRRKAARRREQAVQHVTYAHKTCPECGHVQDKDATVCTSCGAKLGKRGVQMLGRLGILMPVAISISTLLALVMLATYARVWLAGGGGMSSPSPYLLIDFGGRWPPYIDAEPWRLLTSVFLHANLLHIAFNLIAIASIGPAIEETYGKATMIGMFVITGVVANLGALYVGHMVGVGIGASGGLCGLIGMAAGYGHRAGTGRGRAIRNAMLKWMAYTIIFGFAVGADNWAHLFGAIAGGLFGLAIKPETWGRRIFIPLRVLLGLAGAAGTIAAVVIIFTRHPTAPDEETAEAMYQQSAQKDAMAKLTQGMIDICVPYYAGDTPKATAAAKKQYETISGDTDAPMPDETLYVRQTCESIQNMRVVCAQDHTKEPQEQRDYVVQACDMYKPVFDALPVRPPEHPAPE